MIKFGLKKLGTQFKWPTALVALDLKRPCNIRQMEPSWLAHARWHQSQKKFHTRLYKFNSDVCVTLANNLLAKGPSILIFNIVHRNWWLPVFIFDASSKLAHPSFFLVCLSRDIGIIPSSFQYHRLLVVLMFWLLFSSTT